MLRFARTAPVLAAPVLTALLALGAAPANAATATIRDPRGDAPARYDLTTTRVTNSDTHVQVVARVRDLRGGRTQIFGANLTPVRGDSTYALQTVRRTNGTTTSRLMRYDTSGAERVRCAITSRWRTGKDTISTSVGRDCITEAGPVRVSVAIGRGNGSSGDPIDWTRATRVTQG